MIEIKKLNLTKEIPEISGLDIHVPDGESYVLLSAHDATFDHLTNIFAGMEQDFTGQVRLDDADICSQWGQCSKNTVLLSTGREWPPDMKIGTVVSFFKRNMNIPEEEFEELYIELNIDGIYHHRISELREVEWRKILFSLARLKKSRNYIFRDFAGGMPPAFNLEFKKSISGMKKRDCSILYLSADVFFAPEIGDRIGFMKKGKLLLELKASKLKKMELNELYFQFLAER